MIAAKEEPDHRKELNDRNLTDDEVFVNLSNFDEVELQVLL